MPSNGKALIQGKAALAPTQPLMWHLMLLETKVAAPGWVAVGGGADTTGLTSSLQQENGEEILEREGRT